MTYDWLVLCLALHTGMANTAGDATARPALYYHMCSK